jgi:adenylate cyclase
LLYLFEDYALDRERRELRRGDAPVAIEPKVFDLLAFLIENRQRVVSRDDLIAHVWDGRIVSESALARCIYGARSAIGDDGDAQRLIKTIQRKGLRFVGAVREQHQPSGVADAGIGAEQPAALLTLPDRPSIAVLPLHNTSGDQEQDYFSDGITEDLITELSRFTDLFVIAHNSSFQYKGKAIDVRQVGRELGVRYVLQGSIRRGGDRIRISMQLIDAVTGANRWAERYDRQLDDVMAVQDEVARTIVATLAAHVNRAEIERTINKPPEAWQAYDYYLRATDASASFFSSYKAADLYEARRFLEHAIAIDPNYAPAYARLSWSYLVARNISLDGDYLNPAALDRAYQLASKAVQLDSNLPQAHVHLGHVLHRRRKHEAAVAEFERAMALNPNFSDWRFAEVLIYAGDPARAIEVVERHMRLDPFYAPLAAGWLGLAHYMLKQYAQALAPLRECTSRAPNLPVGHACLAATYAQLGDLEKARAAVAEVLRVMPKWTIEGVVPLNPFKRPEDAEHFFDARSSATFRRMIRRRIAGTKPASLNSIAPETTSSLRIPRAPIAVTTLLAPSRWTVVCPMPGATSADRTASWFGSASRKSVASSGSPRRTVIPPAARGTSFSGDRTKAVTRWPRSLACSTSARPIPPVAPMTSNRSLRWAPFIVRPCSCAQVRPRT